MINFFVMYVLHIWHIQAIPTYSLLTLIYMYMYCISSIRRCPRIVAAIATHTRSLLLPPLNYRHTL